MAGSNDPPEERPASADELAQAYEELLQRQNDAPLPVDSSDRDVPPPVHRLIEALVFLGGPPLTADRAAEAIRGLTTEQFLDSIESLNRSYRSQGRGYRLRPRGQGYELALVPRLRFLHDRLYGSVREARLSPAALDVLALVAYRQPVNRAEIESLRGTDSSALLRQLVRVGLVTMQRGDSSQQPVAYGTTRRFLTLFGLRSLDDLPRTEDLKRL